MASAFSSAPGFAGAPPPAATMPAPAVWGGRAPKGQGQGPVQGQGPAQDQAQGQGLQSGAVLSAAGQYAVSVPQYGAPLSTTMGSPFGSPGQYAHQLGPSLYPGHGQGVPMAMPAQSPPLPPGVRRSNAMFYGRNPVRVVCVHCGTDVVTVIRKDFERETQDQWMACVFCCCCPCLACIPLLCQGDKPVHHHCPNCMAHLGTGS